MATLSRGTAPSKREANRKTLLEATRSLLDEDIPFVDLRIETITQRAGISRSAFYDHYADKRELLLALIDAFMTPFFEQIEAYVSAPTVEPTMLLPVWTAMLDAALDATFRNRTLVLATREAAGYDPAIAATWDELLDRVEHVVQQRIEHQQAQGLAQPGPARATAVALVAMLEGSFVRQLRRPENLDRSELVMGLTAVWGSTVYGASQVVDALGDSAPPVRAPRRAGRGRKGTS